MENKNSIRTYLRSLISKNIYNKLAVTLNKIETIRCQGFNVYSQLFNSSQSNNKTKSINFRNIQYPIYFRPSTIDVPTIVQSLIRKEYGKGLPKTEPTLIIDAGCFIGDVSVFYLNKYRSCSLIALEPNYNNYKLAKSNLSPYGKRVILLNKGLWSSKTTLSFSGDFTSGSVKEGTNGNKITCTDVISLLNEYNLTKIDILKMDIEGAESEVILNNSDRWLPHTRMISVEFHGTDIQQKCLTKLYEFGFDGFEYRSIYNLYNKNLL